MALSAESQDDEMAYSHDDVMLSTVEEGSEESQIFTQNPPLDDEQREGGDDSADNASDCEPAIEQRQDDTSNDFCDEGEEDESQEAHQYIPYGEEQASADDAPGQDESQYEQQEDEGDDEETVGEAEETHHPGEDDQQATEYVGQCHTQLEHLRKRKREQEEHVEHLVEATFSQIDTLVNTLMSTIQECHAASHNRFEIADAKLARNLQFHNRMEKKLRMIASILLEESASTQEEE